MSKIEVDAIDKQSGSTLTLGGSGTAVTLACGATQTGFGRTGTVDWNTTPKTATFTAVSGDGFFCNTTSGAFTCNLPAGSAGAIVSLADYAATWQTNNLTVTPNGTDKIGSVNASVTLNTEGQSVTFVFVDSTQGWINTMDSTSNVRGNAFVVGAVSGSCNTLTTAPCGNYKLATFKGPGTFTVSNVGTGSNSVEYLVSAGGGGGGNSCISGGGGAGGVRFAAPSLSPLTYPAKPLAAPANLPVSVQAYPISVGGGGAGGTSPTPTGPATVGTPGVVSTFSTITSTGGGGGAGRPTGGQPGGSGGGSDYSGTGGTGNTPPVSPAQGTNGGSSSSGAPYYGAAGGGGFLAAGAAGTGGPPNPGAGGAGGAGGGFPTLFGTAGQNCGANYYFGGGGAGANEGPTRGTGGLGGGGQGGFGGNSQPLANRQGIAGTANTGGGGGGTDGTPYPAPGVAGGSGIVIIRYKFQ